MSWKLKSTFLFLLLCFFEILSLLSASQNMQSHQKLGSGKVLAEQTKFWQLYQTYLSHVQTYYQSDFFLGKAYEPFQHLVELCTLSSSYLHLLPIPLFSILLPSTNEVKCMIQRTNKHCYCPRKLTHGITSIDIQEITSKLGKECKSRMLATPKRCYNKISTLGMRMI